MSVIHHFLSVDNSRWKCECDGNRQRERERERKKQIRNTLNYFLSVDTFCPLTIPGGNVTETERERQRERETDREREMQIMGSGL